MIKSIQNYEKEYNNALSKQDFTLLSNLKLKLKQLNDDKIIINQIINVKSGYIQKQDDISDKLAKFDHAENERLNQMHNIKQENIKCLEYNMQDELNKYRNTIYEYFNNQ